MDWKNSKDYEFTKKLNDEQWAWEFLRRNKDYIKEWETEFSLWREKIKQLAPNELIKKYGVFETDQNNTHFFIPSKKAQTKWGLEHGYINPAQDSPDLNIPLSFLPSYGQMIWTDSDQESINIELRKNEIAVTFDLSLPVKPQIKLIEKNLRKIQQKETKKVKHPKQHKGNRTLYLRILDAPYESMKQKEIAAILFPKIDNKYPNYEGNRNFRDCKKAALSLMNKGYLSTVSLSTIEL